MADRLTTFLHDKKWKKKKPVLLAKEMHNVVSWQPLTSKLSFPKNIK